MRRGSSFGGLSVREPGLRRDLSTANRAAMGCFCPTSTSPRTAASYIAEGPETERTVIRQETPPGLKLNSTFPVPSANNPRLSKLVPNPVLAGVDTGGPPLSCQSRIIPSGDKTQEIATLPEATESAPYLTAFVLSSWRAMPRLTATPLGMRSSLPRAVICIWSLNGVTISSTISPTGTASQFPLVSKSVAEAKA